MAVTYQGQFTAAMRAIAGTKAELDATNEIIPGGAIIYESDSAKLKIANGVDLYTALDYLVAETLTAEQKALLVNAGHAGGVVILDSGAKIPLEFLPSAVKTPIRFVANIAARDAIAADNREGIIYVIDASADVTVESGWATYAWQAGAPGAWLKLSEGESLDIDLSNLFDKTNDTLDDIADGAAYVRMTVQERADLAELKTQAVRIGGTYDILAPTPAFYTTTP